MTSLFETYEAEWHGLTDDLYGNVAKIPTLSGPERAAHLQTVQEKLQDAEDAVDGMSIACRGVRNSAELVKRLQNYREELDDLKKQFQKAQYALNPNATAELLGPSHDFNPDSVVADHRALFAGAGRDAVGLLERSDEPLAQATRDLFETEQVALGVMEDLHEQRTTMERFKERLADINASLDTAGRLMQSIMKRIWGNKLILGFVMLLLVAGLVCIVWLRFFPPWEHGGAAQGGGNHTNPHPPPPRE